LRLALDDGGLARSDPEADVSPSSSLSKDRAALPAPTYHPATVASKSANTATVATILQMKRLCVFDLLDLSIPTKARLVL
jgi:hypothetical protein